jgi:WD40 repeat protein
VGEHDGKQRIGLGGSGGLLLSVCLASAAFCWGRPLGAAQPPVTALAFRPDGSSLVAASQSGLDVHHWPELDRTHTLQVAASNLHCLAFSPNGQHLAAGGGYPAEEGVVEVFSWPQGESVARFDDHEDSVRAVVWRGEERLLSASIDRTIRSWNLQPEHPSVSPLQGHSRSVDALVLLDDGQTLVSAGADQSLRVWDLESRQLVRRLSQHTKPVTAMAKRPINRGLPVVASAAADRTIRFWQPTIGRMVRYVRLQARPLDIAWTRDGDWLLAAGTDGAVRLIDPVNVRVIATRPLIDGWAYALAVHPSDGSVAIAGTDGQIRRIQLADLTPAVSP